MWVFSQSSGILRHEQTWCGVGYSGNSVGCNNPAYQQVHSVGPIPQGEWKISGPPIDTDTHGPYVLHLFPKTGTETFQRDGFLIHGDAIKAPGTASKGCIILARALREAIWESGDRDLSVTD